MKQGFTRKAMLACGLFASIFTSATAQNTPIEAFINREKDISNFTPVSNIWQADKGYDQTRMLTKVKNGEALTIDYNVLGTFVNQKLRSIKLQIPKGDGSFYTLALARYDFFTDNFKLEVKGENGSAFYNYKPGVYYRGVVDGVPGSVAAFSFFNNEVYGTFSTPADGNMVVAPNALEGKLYDYNTHYVLYNDKDLLLTPPGCATDDMPQAMHHAAQKTTTNTSNLVYNTCTEIKVYELADYGTYVSKGHSVANVVNYLTSLFNNQATLYKNESILIALNYVLVDSTTDSYYSLPTNNSGTWLTAFGNATQNNLYNSDMGIMYTTRGGGMGGVAWLQALCYAYSGGFGPYAFCNIDNSAVVNFPTFSWDVEVATHEMGHVVGSPHTHACCWNPPGTGTTAIDGCYTLEGSCAMPNPQYPTGGGTIMSYCHLTGVGINFSYGFGTQPGDTIRNFIAQQQQMVGCGQIYNPTTALANVNHTINANRECTDPATGITYYWNDHNSAAQTDDTLVLMIKKNGVNIGNMDVTGFSVKTATLPLWATGVGDTATFPVNSPFATTHTITMRRYYNINATTQPSSPVEVIFPFLSADTADVHGSIPPSQLANLDITRFDMYITKNSINPNPSLNFSGANSSDFQAYKYADTASTTTWTVTNVGNTLLAHMKTSTLKGGGTGLVSYWPLGVKGVSKNNNVVVYPNPAHNEWYVSTSPNLTDLTLHLYGADGKIVQVQQLESGKVNTVNLGNLPTGIYFYRIFSSTDLYTGNIVKQ
jgi:hypothetical protein